jgi:hypothetical protein
MLVERGRLLFSACAENLSGLALAHCLGTPLALALGVRVFQWLEKVIPDFPIPGNPNLRFKPLLNSKHTELKDSSHKTQTQRL